MTGTGPTVVAWHRFGPYHHARIAAARRRLRVVSLELTHTDRVYAWEQVPATHPDHLTLIPGDPEELSADQLRSRLFAAMDQLSPAVVAIPGWGARWARLLLLWCLLRRVPSIVMSASNASDAARNPLAEAVKRRIVSLFDAGIVGGSRSAAYLSNLGMDPGRVFLGYDAVDNSHFANPTPSIVAEVHATAPKSPFFLTTARFVEKKNLHRLVEAYARYRQLAGPAAWDLVLIGDGPVGASIVELSERFDLSAHVQLPGFRQYAELPGWYAHASCFVLPSTTEQWGLVVNEAMAAGLPVIVSQRCGCVPELVAHERNGLIIDPLDVEGMAVALHRVAHGDLDRDRMAEQSRERIGDWGPDRFAEALADAVALSTRSAMQPRRNALHLALLRVLA